MAVHSSLCSVVIVANNSAPFLEKALLSLKHQAKQPNEVIVVDSGSACTNYLKTLSQQFGVKVVMGGQGIGFCKANNIGFQLVSNDSEFVFFLNPDAFPFPCFIERAICFLNDPLHRGVAAVTGKTFGYCIENNRETGLYDTTGIFRTWYRRWYDRGQREEIQPELYRDREPLEAICGAVFFGRREALEQVKIDDRQVFRESFYMYKEDIELSLRLREKGWELYYLPELEAYHCRGWSVKRKAMPRRFRMLSARNELTLHWSFRFWPGVLYSAAKCLSVKLFNR